MKIVVLTCDKYCWVLPIFRHFFEKFWLDCPWSLELVGGPRFIELFSGYDWRLPVTQVSMSVEEPWSDMLIAYLMGYCSPDDLVLLLLEDYLLSDRIDTKPIQSCINIIQADPTVQFVRLNPCPGPEHDWVGWLDVGLFDKEEATYLASTQPTIYKVEYLLRLLRPGESPWGHEINGSERARKLPGVYLGSTKTLVPVMNFLRRGQVEPNALKEAKEKW